MIKIASVIQIYFRLKVNNLGTGLIPFLAKIFIIKEGFAKNLNLMRLNFT